MTERHEIEILEAVQKKAMRGAVQETIDYLKSPKKGMERAKCSAETQTQA